MRDPEVRYRPGVVSRLSRREELAACCSTGPDGQHPQSFQGALAAAVCSRECCRRYVRLCVPALIFVYMWYCAFQAGAPPSPDLRSSLRVLRGCRRRRRGLMIDRLGIALRRLRFGGLVLGHALLERLDALRKSAHQRRDLSAPPNSSRITATTTIQCQMLMEPIGNPPRPRLWRFPPNSGRTYADGG